MERFRNKYRISPFRLQTWNYAWDGYYFITICTKNRKCYFGEIQNGKMQLPTIGNKAFNLWYEIKNHAKNVSLGEFVVMPNHVHGILILSNYDSDCRDKICLGQKSARSQEPIGQLRFQNQGKNTVSSIIGAYKSAVSKQAHYSGRKFSWQSRFYDHIIRNEESLLALGEYIRNNPKSWQKDKLYFESH